MGQITSLLKDVREGRDGAEDRLFAEVYDDLRNVARFHLQNRPDRGLQATALVHAAYERLAAREALDANDRRHLFYLFSRAMHDVLVEQVRADLAHKRGGQLQKHTFVELAADGDTHRVDILDLQQALSELEQIDPIASRIVILRYYGGLTLEEAAQATSMTFAIARRNWDYARAWLHQRLSEPSGRPIQKK